jgi:phage gp36-like protein
MAYCTLTDLKNTIPEEQLKQLSDDSDVDTIDVEKVTESIRKADTVIDGYCRGRYSVPLVTVPEAIRNVSIGLSLYYLFSRSLMLTMPDSIKEMYAEAMRVLKDIQAGRFSPFEATEEPAFFGTNKVDTDNVTATLTSDWEAY